MTEKKLFRGTVTMYNKEQVEYYRYAVNAQQAYRIIKKKHNCDYDREPWAYVSMEVEEV